MSEFPDVVALLIAYLEDHLDEPIHNEIPTERPESFLRVWRIGGVAELPVRDVPNIEFTAWAPTAVAAMDLLYRARAKLWALAGGQFEDGTQIYRMAELAGPRQGTDPNSESPIAAMTTTLTIRANPVIQPTN